MNNNKNYRACRLGMSVLFLIASSCVFAFHPIAKKGPFDAIYPEYPTVDYGTGDQAKLIKRGEYLTKAGDCLACHTNVKAGGKPFAGGLPIHTPFGTFYSPNITGDELTGIGKWTEKQFITSMRHGKRPDGSNNFPVFPFIYFSKTNDDDLRAIFAYLKAVPAVRQPNRELSFPYNLPGARLGITGWKLLFFRDRKPYQYNPKFSKRWNRGAYLVQGLGHCSMCHTPLNVLGAPKKEYYLTGAFVDGYWSPNITGYGLKSASIYEVANVFKKGELINQAGPVAGPMADVNHDSLKYLNEEDRLSIATYLKTVSSIDPRRVDPSHKQPTLKRGKQVYINACIMCHQENVIGAPAIGDGAGWYNRVKSQGLPALYRHTIQGFNKMPVRGACVTCSDNDIEAAVDYILHESVTHAQWQKIKSGKMTAKSTAANGRKVYDENCSVCHNEGKLGSPKLGDRKIWSYVLRKNMDEVIFNAVYGKDGVHVRGGCEHCTNTEVIAAVKYMVNESSDKNYKLW